MLIYNELKNKPRAFLAATGLKLDEFEQLLPAFQMAYEKQYPPPLTQEGKIRQRQIGGGATGALPKIEDKLFFILVYQKTNPLQTMHGLHFGLSQPQANDWIHRLLPVLQQALRDLGEAPARDARHVATSELARAGGPDLTIDGSERRRQRPQDRAKQKEHYSGKKKAPTDKNGCVPPFTPSVLKRAVMLMMPTMRRQRQMDQHGGNVHVSGTKSAS